ncbi:MAG: energy transducer TonB [Gammaproteobacteria bacterium]|nr:energy transducer TonB [Gammaproteobacteria bacterium]
MNLNDRQINITTLFLSLLVHVALFVQFSNSPFNSGQAQAPVFDTRISLNLLPTIKQTEPVKPEPVKPEKQVKKKIEKKKKVVTPPAHEQATAPEVSKEVQRQYDNKRMKIRQKYFSTLLTHIESYKFYPRNARRRGIEGSIQITFRLFEDGSIAGLDANGGPTILMRAAKNSVSDALPLPKCPSDVACPMQISFAMQFKLNSDI